MKVYCVVPYYGEDGCWYPDTVFSSREAAEAFVAGLDSFARKDREICEYEIGVRRKD